MSRFFLCTAATLALMAGSASAQELCGGNGANGEWIGGTEAASDIAAAETHAEQMALVLGGNAYVSLFSLSAPTDVRIEAAGRGNGDPVVEIFDAAGGIVASDDDSGGNGAARVEMGLDAGTYCISMKGYDATPMTAFVRVGQQSHEALTTGADTSGGSSDDAAACEDPTPFGAIGTTASASAADSPAYGFSLSEPTAISITASNETADPSISLIGADGESIADNDDYDGLNSRIDVSAPLAAGDYCLKIEALSDATAPIDVAISLYDPEAALAALYARGEAAPPLDGSVPVTALGALASRMRQDVQLGEDASWYTVEIPEAGLLLIEAIAPAGKGDPWLVLFDDFGRQLAQNDDHSEGLDAMVTAKVQAGTYMVGIKDVGDGSSGLARLLLERFVPAK